MIDSLHIFVDADACPVKDETYKVALRYGIAVSVVSNAFMRLPDHPLIARVIVAAGPDVADDYIAERANAGSIVITADILLAERCIKAGATVIAPNGKPFKEASIGAAVATRALMDQLRSTGDITGGPAPFSAKDRSRFLQALDLAVTQLKRR